MDFITILDPVSGTLTSLGLRHDIKGYGYDLFIGSITISLGNRWIASSNGTNTHVGSGECVSLYSGTLCISILMVLMSLSS